MSDRSEVWKKFEGFQNAYAREIGAIGDAYRLEPEILAEGDGSRLLEHYERFAGVDINNRFLNALSAHPSTERQALLELCEPSMRAYNAFARLVRERHKSQEDAAEASHHTGETVHEVVVINIPSMGERLAAHERLRLGRFTINFLHSVHESALPDPSAEDIAFLQRQHEALTRRIQREGTLSREDVGLTPTYRNSLIAAAEYSLAAIREYHPVLRDFLREGACCRV